MLSCAEAEEVLAIVCNAEGRRAGLGRATTWGDRDPDWLVAISRIYYENLDGPVHARGHGREETKILRSA